MRLGQRQSHYNLEAQPLSGWVRGRLSVPTPPYVFIYLFIYFYPFHFLYLVDYLDGVGLHLRRAPSTGCCSLTEFSLFPPPPRSAATSWCHRERQCWVKEAAALIEIQIEKTEERRGAGDLTGTVDWIPRNQTPLSFSLFLFLILFLPFFVGSEPRFGWRLSAAEAESERGGDVFLPPSEKKKKKKPRRDFPPFLLFPSLFLNFYFTVFSFWCHPVFYFNFLKIPCIVSNIFFFTDSTRKRGADGRWVVWATARQKINASTKRHNEKLIKRSRSSSRRKDKRTKPHTGSYCWVRRCGCSG